jgi:DNA-binding transcriptional LysR family regulator
MGDALDLNAILIFNRVVQAASFSRAAADLGLTKSTVSKKVSELEAQLGISLLRRTTRSLRLTEQGRQFHEQCSKALGEIREATEGARAAGAAPRGKLRITAPADFAGNTLAALFAEFLDAHPQISLELVLSDRTLDLVNDNIDVAIRLGKLSDSSLLAKKVGRDVFQLVASPAYLKEHGIPSDPAELGGHACLLFAPRSGLSQWELRAGPARAVVDPKPKFAANSVTTVKGMALSGAGIALLPVSNCREELAAKKLKVVLPEWSMDIAPVHFVYQKHLFLAPKVKVFLEFMEKRLKPYLA